MYTVLIVMSTYNGEKFIQEQIDSILTQKFVKVVLKIRDDGSTDSTPEIIRKNAVIHDNILFDLGNNVGFQRSFFETLISTPDLYDYYAFSDQDDVWEPEKLYHAISRLEQESRDVKLYSSGLKVVDQDLKFLYDNVFNGLRISFGSALTRQRLAGCTMVFSKDLFHLCQKFKITERMGNLFSHDAVVYYVCLVCGGTIAFEPKGEIKFRRHEGTVTEHGKGCIKRIGSVLNIFCRFRKRRFNQVKELMAVYQEQMPYEILKLTDEILHYKDSIHNTFMLCLNSEINCGIKSVDLINKLAILFRCY